LKPFIKSPTAVPTPAPVPVPVTIPAAPTKMSPGELTILSVASAIADPAERSAYLDRVCAEDPGLRGRVEQRLAERAAMQPTVQRAEMMTMTGGGGAVALVPMPDMQMTPAGAQPVRQSTFPWLLATVLAGAVGALAVIFANERAAHSAADHQAQAAVAAKATAESERDAAIIKTLDAQTAVARANEKLKAEEQQRKAAETEAEKAKGEAKKATADAAEVARLATTKAATAESSAKQGRDQFAAYRLEQANTLEKLATALIEQGKHGEAVAPAQSAAQLREQVQPNAPAVVAVDARFLLGSALMGKGDVAAAEKEFLTVIGALEPLQAQGGEAERTKYVTVVKKLAQLYNTTGRKKEASEWRHKVDNR